MKRKLLILTISLLLLTLLFSACSGSKKIDGMKITDGLAREVEVGATLDTSKVTVEVTYNDKTTEIVGADQLTFSTIDTSKAGTQKLTITYQDFSITVDITVKASTVNNNNNEGTEIWGVDMPAGIAAFVANAKAFEDKTVPYRVGDDNPFRFELTLKIWDEEKDQPSSAVMPYVGSSKVYLIEGTNATLLEGDALAAMVAIDEEKHTFDFTDAAVGKTFRIETSPTGNLVDPEQCVAQLTFEVVDAYNIYDAKELNIITNYNSTDIQDYGQTSKTQLEAVNDFLANNNITRPENLAGVVLQCSLNITMDDLPAEYFYDYTSEQFGPSKHFYDHFSVYQHATSDANPTFTLHGNYNTIYSYNLPIVCDNGVGGNDDDFSSTELFNFDIDREAVFTAYGQAYKGDEFHTRVENVSLRGDDPNDISEANTVKHMRALIGIKTHLQITDIYNTRIEKFGLSICVDGDNQTVNVDKCNFFNAWMNHFYLWSSNYVNSWVTGKDAAPHANYYGLRLNVTDSTLSKCGGPVLIADYPDLDKAYNQSTCVEVNIDADTEVWTYVTGQETWFRANGVSDLATFLLGFNLPVSNLATASGASASITSTNNPGMQGTESSNVIFCNRGPRGKLVYEGHGTLDMQNPIRQALLASPFAAAPMLQSAAGGVLLSDAQYNLFTLQGTAPGADANTAAFLQGNAFNIFYDNMGVMTGYYH